MNIIEILRIIFDLIVIAVGIGIAWGAFKTKLAGLEKNLNKTCEAQNCLERDLTEIKERLARIEQQVNDIKEVLNLLKR